jgi:hypothetical protein
VVWVTLHREAESLEQAIRSGIADVQNAGGDVARREWKNKSGKFSVLAEFQGLVDGHVQLRKPDGSDISVDKKLLSTDDQRWVAAELRRRREEEEENYS